MPRDPLHLGIAQVAVLFLHYLLFGRGELIDVVVDFVNGAEAGAKQNVGAISRSVSFLFGNVAVLQLHMGLTRPYILP